MKSQILIIIIFFFSVAISLAQKDTSTAKIIMEGERKLIFPNGKTITEPKNGWYSVSPSRIKAAVLTIYTGLKETSLLEYDINGNEIGNFKVASFDKCAIADDGSFALYGTCPNFTLPYKTRLQLYSNTGILINDYSENFTYIQYAVFHRNGTFAFTTSVNDGAPVEFKLLIFNNTSTLISSSVFSKGWPEYHPIKAPEFSEDGSSIKIYHAKRNNNSIIKKSSLIFDLQGNLINEIIDK